MKLMKCLLCMIFISLPSIIYSQYLEPEDINVFINGYVQIKNTIDEHSGDRESDDWIKYNELKNSFSTVEGGYERGPVNYIFNAIERNYRELLDCKVPQELETILRSTGWETSGHKKYITITFGWGFLYAVKEMEEEINNMPRWVFKLFIEKYYLEMLNILKMFNEHDLNIIRTRMEEITNVMNENN